MKKKIKALTLIMVLVLSLQSVMIVNGEGLVPEPQQGTAISFIVQPQGVYLNKGRSSIAPASGYVTVWGTTEAYSSVSEISVTLTIYKEISTNVWSYVWSNTVTDYNTDYCDFPKVNVNVSSGRYKVEGTHTTKHAGRVESNTSMTQPITVY
jgi:hypothetical protein